MIPPKDAKIIEWPTSIMWFDELGILYSIPKPIRPELQSREEGQRQMDLFRKLVGNKKTCMISEASNSSAMPKKEDRDWITKELNSVVKAMAIISTSPLSRMIGHLFFGLQPPAYPYKYFSNEIEAKKWIKQYL